jgi:hypothetical protein
MIDEGNTPAGMVRRALGKIRRNHGLEHATVTLMLAKEGPMRVVGRAGTDGFYIYAKIPTEKLREYADEALTRLQAGEARLAVTPLCGTNIAVAGAMAGVASFVAIATSRNAVNGLVRAVVASTVAIVASQPVARVVQKNYTTSPDLAGFRIVSVDAIGGSLHKVRTAAD